MRWQLDAQSGLLTCNRDMLVGAALNLIHNALHATAGSGRPARLKVHLYRRDGELRLAISDSGPGIPPAVQQRLGEPFLSTKTSGTGLGLPVALAMAKAHGGRLAVRSQLGRGTLVTFILPLRALAEEPFGLVINDVNMPGIDGHQLLASIRLRDPALPVLLMTAFGSIERAVEAMRSGAADYLVKPFEPRLLLDTLARCCPQERCVPGARQSVAADFQSRQLLELAGRVAQSETTVLITGESGTGKEVLARFIHDQSAQADGPFVAVNCAAIRYKLAQICEAGLNVEQPLAAGC